MFPELKGNGRVWIYVARRPLNAVELHEISELLQTFTSSWQAHGADLLSSFTIYKNQIIILAIDEHFEAASGCSIDNAFAIFRQIDAKYELDLFNRMNLVFLDREKLRIIPLNTINEAFESGMINGDSLFMDASINTLNELRTGFLKPLASSWLVRKIRTLA